MMLTLRAASLLCVVLRSHAARPSHAARADRNDTTVAVPNALTKEDSPPLGGAKREEEEDPQGLNEAAVKPSSTGALDSGADVETPASGASVHAEHFEKTVAHTKSIKAAVDQVHMKTQVAKEAAVAVKDSFGKYQGTISDLKAQLDSVDGVTHKFEDELWEHLAGEESTRLQPFEEYKKQFGGVEGVEEAEGPTVESFLEGGRQARHSSSNETGGNRFEKSVQQSEQIKVAVGKVKEKVELTRQAAAKVKQGFEDYKGKVVEVRNQLSEVDKQQHEYHEKLLNHYDGQEGDRMSAFDNPPSLENATAAESGLLQGRERWQLSKERVGVNVGGSFHAARH